MREIVASDDPVLVNYVETLLRGIGIATAVYDRHASSLHGAVGRAPQRVVVEDDDWGPAAQLLKDAGLEAWIVDGGDRW
jgi:hypothetical protein